MCVESERRSQWMANTNRYEDDDRQSRSALCVRVCDLCGVDLCERAKVCMMFFSFVAGVFFIWYAFITNCNPFFVFMEFTSQNQPIHSHTRTRTQPLNNRRIVFLLFTSTHRLLFSFRILCNEVVAVCVCFHYSFYFFFSSCVLSCWLAVVFLFIALSFL